MEGASGPYNPRTAEEVFKDFRGRRSGMINALTTGALSFLLSVPGTLPRFTYSAFCLSLSCSTVSDFPCRLFMLQTLTSFIISATPVSSPVFLFQLIILFYLITEQ